MSCLYYYVNVNIIIAVHLCCVLFCFVRVLVGYVIIMLFDRGTVPIPILRSAMTRGVGIYGVKRDIRKFGSNLDYVKLR